MKKIVSHSWKEKLLKISEKSRVRGLRYAREGYTHNIISRQSAENGGNIEIKGKAIQASGTAPLDDSCEGQTQSGTIMFSYSRVSHTSVKLVNDTVLLYFVFDLLLYFFCIFITTG